MKEILQKNHSITKKSSLQSFIEGSDRKYRTKDNHTRIFRTYDFYVYDKNNDPIFIQTTIEDITNQKLAEERQQRNLDRLRSLVNIFQFQADNNQDFLDFALNEAIKLTSSNIGHILFYDEDHHEITMNTWSPKTIIKDRNKTRTQLATTGILGESIRQRKTFIMNQNLDSYPRKNVFSECPAHFNRFLSVPIINKQKIVAVIGVANKNDDYDESDALQLSLLMESIWRIIEQRSAVEALSSSEAIQRNLINATQDIVTLKDNEFKLIMVNHAAEQFYNKSENAMIGKTDFDLLSREQAAECHTSDQNALSEKKLISVIEHLGNQDYEVRKFPVPINNNKIGIGAFIRNITRQIESEASIKLQSTALNATANAIVITDPAGIIEWVNPAFSSLTGYSTEECIGRNPHDLVYSGRQIETFYTQMWQTILAGKVWKGRLVNRKKDESLFSEEMTITPLLDENGGILHFIAIKQDVTETDQHERELAIIANVSAALRSANSPEEMFSIILNQLITQLNVEAATLLMRNPVTDEMVIELGRGLWKKATGLRIPPGKGLGRKILDSGQPYLNTTNSDPLSYEPSLFSNCHFTAGVPLVVQNNKLGVLFIGNNRKMNARDVRLLTAVADIAAISIHRSTLLKKTQEKVNQLNSLRVIDQAINTSLDLRVTLDVILKQTQKLLGCSALAVLLSKPYTTWLEHTASLGFHTNAIEKLHLHINSNIAGQSILERQVKSIDRSQPFPNDETEKLFLEGENFQSFHTAPLIVKGIVKGVMVVYNREPISSDPDWIEILNTLATQTAIAIDNDDLFNGLQRSAVNLTFAYNETIEGWAKALELRDQETEGHSKRVTDLTIKLAIEMGIKDEEIGHIMRGALLHDIGKMAIPDAILRKPGKLTEKEWEIIRKHPGDAYNMLSAIKYLQPALDIPYCHHEKWDGSGYPRKLKGKIIPLSARIFAVVDVWDALTSDRPYRKAWSKIKTRDYILSQSGIHFDPEIVDIFYKKFLIRNI